MRRIASKAGLSVEPVASAIIADGRAVVFASGGDAGDVPAHFVGLPYLRKPFTGAELFAALTAVRSNAVATS